MAKLIVITGITGVQVGFLSEFYHFTTRRLFLTLYSGKLCCWYLSSNPRLHSSWRHSQPRIRRRQGMGSQGSRNRPRRPGRCQIPRASLSGSQCHLWRYWFLDNLEGSSLQWAKSTGSRTCCLLLWGWATTWEKPCQRCCFNVGNAGKIHLQLHGWCDKV